MQAFDLGFLRCRGNFCFVWVEKKLVWDNGLMWYFHGVLSVAG